MLFKNVAVKSFFAILALLLSANCVLAADGTTTTAEKLLIWQLEAIKDGDYERFTEHCNQAFKELADKWWFDTLKMSKGGKISKGYTLEYLGAIRRVGMQEHLWKVSINGEKYNLLARLTVSHEKVVGFDLD